jgi:hypothetical protein
MSVLKHAATAAVAMLFGAVGGIGLQYARPQIVEKPVHVTVAASKHAWPDMTQAETIALGEALSSLKGEVVSILCNDAACDDLAHDIDDAMQIADARSSLDRAALPLGYGFAVFTGPGDDRGPKIAAAIKTATAGKLSPEAQTSDTAKGMVLIVIGKRR